MAEKEGSVSVKETILANLSPRKLNPTENESLRDAEVRWQRDNDPLIAAAFKAGATMREIAERVQMSTTAVGSSLRRSEIKPPKVQRTFQNWPVPIDYRALVQAMERDRLDTLDYLRRLDAAIAALTNCLPFLAPEPQTAPEQMQEPVDQRSQGNS